MLFKNLKTGNCIEIKDPGVIEMAKESANYEAVNTSTPLIEVETPVKKKGRKPKE